MKSFVRVAQMSSRACRLALEADAYQESGVFVGSCLPSRLSRVRASSPAFLLNRLSASAWEASSRQPSGDSAEGDGFLLRRKVFNEFLPPNWYPSCLRQDATPCFRRLKACRDEWVLRGFLFKLCFFSSRGCSQARRDAEGDAF